MTSANPENPGPANFEAAAGFNHQTVMPRQAIEALDIKPGGVYVDGTMGGGGHSRLILARLGPEGRLICLDQDPAAWGHAGNTWAAADSRVKIAAGNFAALPEILNNLDSGLVEGILLDLGLSSHQLFSSGRGFAIASEDEALDMRMDPSAALTAAEIVNAWPESRLADLLHQSGEERAARKVARAIVRARARAPIATTGQLAKVVLTALWRPGRPPKIHPATKTFMALRIGVNRELEVLEEFLSRAPGLIKTGGRLVVISFHSLEDRRVKEAFRWKDQEGLGYWRPLFKKPLVPDLEELAANPRSRSAKLRAAARSERPYV